LAGGLRPDPLGELKCSPGHSRNTEATSKEKERKGEEKEGRRVREGECYF